MLHCSPQLVAAPAVQVAKEPALATQMYSYYQGLKDFSADFQQTKTLKVEDVELKSSGTLKVSLGRALLWDIKSPGRLSVFFDQSLLRIRSGEGATATTATYDLKTGNYSEKITANMRELTALLAMDKAAMADQYTVTADGQQLNLQPKKIRQFLQVSMRVAKAGWIASIKIAEVSSDQMLIEFAAPQKTDTKWIETWTNMPNHSG